MMNSRLFRFFWLITGVTILCLTAFRLWLPNFIDQQLSDRFERMDSYSVTFSDIDVSLLKGSYSIKNIQVLENGSKAPIPLFTADAITYSLPLSYLSNGDFFCVLSVQKPTINFIRGPSPESSQLGMEHELVRLLKKLSPYPVDQFSVVDGAISFRDYHQTPRIEMEIGNISMTGTNLRNSKRLETLLPGKISGKGNVGSGTIQLQMDVNPLQSQPIFNMSTLVKDVDLTYLSGLLQSDHQIHIDRGLLSFEAVANSKDNVITTQVTRKLQNVHATRSRGTRTSRPDQTNEKNARGRVMLTSWNATSDKAGGSQLLHAEVQNYKGNLLTLTGEALVGVFQNGIISEIERSVASPTRKTTKKIMVAKTDKKEDKKNFLEKLFKKKGQDDDNKEQTDSKAEKKIEEEEETISASER